MPSGLDAKVSVVVIFLDAASYIEEAVESIRAQTFCNWELLLVDDGSSDGSTQTARNYAEEHSDRIRYLEHPQHQNRGMSASRNLGIAASDGEFIAFLDADDVWLPEKLEQQVALLSANPGADMVYGPTRLWYSWSGRSEDLLRDTWRRPGVRLNRKYEPPVLLRQYLAGRAATPATCSVLIRRDAITRIGGFEESFTGLFEDQAFFVKMFLTARAFVSDGCWDLYRQHDDSACAMAAKTGAYDLDFPNEAHREFLRWVEDYLRRAHEKDARLWRLLRRKQWLYAHPRLHTALARIQSTPSRIGAILWERVAPLAFEVGRWLLPASLRERLWSRWTGQYL